MRLIDTSTLELVEFYKDIPNYAILSHRWGNEEITLQDLFRIKANNKTDNNREGYVKVVKFCRIAELHGLKYGWVDTCCIDKTSSSELAEAINSMYRWYEKSALCFAFLSDVGERFTQWGNRTTTLSKSEWFTRGWTLQELIAPSVVIFLDSKWGKIGTKSSLCAELSKITGIPKAILAGKPPHTASIAQRMSWASKRETTRVEDIAYCLMGLFGVNMPMLYGEGEGAFVRLQEEIIKTSEDHTIFAWQLSNWRHVPPNGGPLASSPVHFSECHDLGPIRDPGNRLLSGVISTDNKGIYLKLSLVPPNPKNRDDIHIAILPCRRAESPGTRTGIPLKPVSPNLAYFTRVSSQNLIEMPLEKNFEQKYPPRRICIQYQPQSSSGTTTTTTSSSRAQHAALVKAAGDGNETLARTILENNVDIDSRDEENRTPLIAAAAGGHSRLVEVLIKHGANIEAVDDGKHTPLISAATCGDVVAVKMLLDNGAQLDATNRRFETALMKASRQGYNNVVKVLLEYGAKLEINNIKDQTALMLAVRNGHCDVVKMLVEKGAYVDNGDAAGNTPLILAAMMREDSMVRILVEGGADLETQTDGYGYTALLWAAEKGQEDLVQFLIDHGADTDAVDDNGDTALEIASREGHKDVVRLLKRVLKKQGARRR
ncbi:ankyrin repeat-containing domain protein [Podospora fimiseda]|uniref:Ankyrin repeat-containing domain protein n=1 Tax=Podospora fimiseda TaxID=252190 RepID=A0AAN6YK95_9PEZI|nr:ankyrin repeat-containing domain protein [Podospora fimiseda]